MLNTHPIQLSQNVFPQPSYPSNGQQPLGGVRQDKPHPPRARTASTQPAPLKKVMRSHEMNSNPSRSQNRPIPKRKTVHLTLWVKPVVKAELQRAADREGLSVSRAGGAYLERALQANIDMQYGALLDTIIDKSLGKHMRAYSTRLAVLLVRSLFTAEQTRSYAYNILGRQPGMTDAELNDIKNGAHNTARANITRITPQLKTLIEAVTKWLVEEVNADG
jgi:hypothetical protein